MSPKGWKPHAAAGRAEESAGSRGTSWIYCITQGLPIFGFPRINSYGLSYRGQFSADCLSCLIQGCDMALAVTLFLENLGL